MSWTAVLSVALGGGLGAGLRYICSLAIIKYIQNPNHSFLATLVVNILGCFILGLITGLVFTRQEVSRELVLFLTTGLCGGFTTFSTFGVESLKLLEKGQWTLFVLYIIVSISLGLLLAFAGLTLGKSL